jgi:hypothetical protein
MEPLRKVRLDEAAAAGTLVVELRTATRASSSSARR